jgi:hypothetical protein
MRIVWRWFGRERLRIYRLGLCECSLLERMLLLLLCRCLYFVGTRVVVMIWTGLPEDAPVTRATPGKRVEDMVSRQSKTEMCSFKNT